VAFIVVSPFGATCSVAAVTVSYLAFRDASSAVQAEF
jgi:hypothetical protein